MKIRILITMFCFLGITYVDAQSLNKLMNNKSKNYKEISKEIQKDKKYLDNASKKELKTYNRWRWFWDTRVDSTGSFEKYSNAMDNFFNTSYPDGIVTSQPMLKSASTLSWESL